MICQKCDKGKALSAKIYRDEKKGFNIEGIGKFVDQKEIVCPCCGGQWENCQKCASGQNINEIFESGIAAYKAEKRDEARKIFIALVKQEPDNERAWGWMYQVSNNDQERIHCMKQALRINPSNEKAKQLLANLTKQDLPITASTQTADPPAQAQTSNDVIVQKGSQEGNGNPNMKKCPYCAELILQEAIVCRFCGRELLNQKIPVGTPPTMEKVPPPKKSTSNPSCAVIVIGLVLLFFVSCFFVSLLGSTTSSTDNSSSEATPTNSSSEATPTNALVMCEYFITQRLKAPSTAKFAHRWELEITTYGRNEGVKDAFRVKGFVDAQNGFGAMIRNNYVCDIQYVGNDNWNIINLTIE